MHLNEMSARKHSAYWRGDMAAHAGETARETGDFHCASCDAVVHVTKGHKIPECPNGHKTYETRTGEPGNKSS